MMVKVDDDAARDENNSTTTIPGIHGGSFVARSVLMMSHRLRASSSRTATHRPTPQPEPKSVEKKQLRKSAQLTGRSPCLLHYSLAATHHHESAVKILVPTAVAIRIVRLNTCTSCVVGWVVIPTGSCCCARRATISSLGISW